MWVPQVSAFGPGVAVVAPSLPGFGGEPPAGDVMTMAAAADHAANAAREAGITSAMVCGLSMGGYVALEVWRRHRDLVAGLVLANTRGDGDDDAAKDRRHQLATRLRAEGNGFMVQSPPPLLSEAAHPARWRLVRNIIAAQPAESIAAAALGMAARHNFVPELGSIDVPALVMSSSADTLIPPDITRELADGIPGARYVLIEGAGHLSNLEAAPLFNAQLTEHWQSL